MQLKQYSVLPGFGPTIGYTLFYLGLVVLLPLSGLFVRTAGLSWDEFISAVGSARVIASYKLTFSTALVGALVNVVFGTILAWCIVRYRFSDVACSTRLSISRLPCQPLFRDLP